MAAQADFLKYQAYGVKLEGLQSERLDPPEGQTRPEAIQLCVAEMVRLAGKLQRLEPVGQRLKSRASVGSPVRAPRRGHVGPRASRPRRRALSRSSSRSADSGDSDEPHPARRGGRVGDTSQARLTSEVPA
jgi:hypothetical protein